MLNSKQSQKATFLLSTTPQTEDIRSHILTLAKQKLRAKRPTRIFLPGGQEVLDSEELSKNLSAAELTLLISSGESYVGNVHDPVQANTLQAQVKVICSPEDLDPLAVTQLKHAASLPGIVQAVGLPDLHPGQRFPIGGSFVSDGYLHPELIGGDIGCGMNLYKTMLKAENLERGNGWKRLAEQLVGLEGEWLTARERKAWAGEFTAEEWDSSLGTIGKGNHFAEIQVVEEGFEGQNNTSGLKNGTVLLLVHSGSRGFGKDILSKQPEGTKVGLKEGTEEANAYMKLHNQAVEWAERNRQLIALRFLAKLEGEEWALPSDFFTSDESLFTSIQNLKSRLAERQIVSLTHNSLTPTFIPSLGRTLLIHRKGAAPALPGSGFLPIPGSRGTRTLFVQPVFDTANSNGEISAFSIAHGAGRCLTRTKALSSLKQKYGNDVEVLHMRSGAEAGKDLKVEGGDGGVHSDLRRRWKGGDTVTSSIVICEDPELVWEEAPEAYKEIWRVGEALEEHGVARIVGWSAPRVSYKVRRE